MNRLGQASRPYLAFLAYALILLSPPALSAFKPQHHVALTRNALRDITRTIDGHTLRFTARAIQQIADANKDQDQGWCLPPFGSPDPPFSISANHFDGEELSAASTLLKRRVDEAGTRLRQTRADGEGARRLLGQALHATQDYYAHSNRAESNAGVDNRLGASTFSAVGPGVATCAAPPNTGTYVAFAGLTSGYWYGCTGEDDNELPAGKCYHGLDGFIGFNHAGTNKDHEGRPNFTAARDLAAQSTRDIINRLLDSDGVRNNLKATAALMGVTTLAFVIDATGSMGTDIAGVQSAVRSIVSAAEAAGETPEYLLVRFGDPDIGDPFVTTDSAAFLAAVDGLSAGGGGDCPELSQGALLKAVGESLPNSSMFLFTDASAKDAGLGGAVNALAQDRDTRISAVLTGSCSPIDPVYKRNTTETGGQMFVVQRGQVGSLFSLVAPQVTGDFEPMLLASGLLASTPREFTIAVDTTVRRAVFSATADELTSATLLRPDGTAVAVGDPDVTSIDLTTTEFTSVPPFFRIVSTGRIVTIELPAPGDWTLRVQGIGEYSVGAQGNTDLFVETFQFVQHGNPKHPGFYSVNGQPLAGQEATALARVGGPANDPAFEAIGMDGASLQPLPLDIGHPDAAEGDYTGTFDLPDTPFRVLVRGTDVAGFPFQRIVAKLIRPQVARVVVDLLSVPDRLLVGVTTTLRFSLLNVGPTATFDITARDNLGFVTSVSPTSVVLDQNGTATIEVDVLPPLTTPDGTSDRLTVVATVRGNPLLANSATVDLVVASNQAPSCEAAVPSITEIWPPDGRFVPITINGVTDPDGDPLNIVVTEVRQDEQPLFIKPAMTCGDAIGVGTSTVSLAAKRLGSSDGRVYHLLITADDGGGGMCQKTVQVCVPHDQGNGSSCVDQGALFDSVSSCK
jgi:von Willebrand factor A domain-containing protein 7